MNQDVDIFAPEPDALDKAVTAFEENVPLAGQIAVGLTPAGIAVDVAEVGKYGRDALRDFSEGRVGSGLGNVGIAGLSAVGLIPIIGDLAKAGGKSVIKRQFLQRTPEGRQKLGQQAGDDVRQIFDEPIPITEKVARMKSHPLLRSGSDKSLRIRVLARLSLKTYENLVSAMRLFKVTTMQSKGFTLELEKCLTKKWVW